MRFTSLVVAPVCLASSTQKWTIDDIDAMIDRDPEFWTSWDTVKKGGMDDFAIVAGTGDEEVLENVEETGEDEHFAFTDGTDTVSTDTVTTKDAGDSLTVASDSERLYASLKVLYELLVENPLAEASFISDRMKERTSPDNPYASVNQIEATRKLMLDACVIPLWAHKALIWMVKPNPEFALRFMDSFIRSFVSAYNAATFGNESSDILRLRYSIWIKYVLIPFAREELVNCEQVPGTDLLRLKSEHLSNVFKDQLSQLNDDPQSILNHFATIGN